jgi:MoaA/NifB/PqqE/SkfB family radical SAM enzyme
MCQQDHKSKTVINSDFLKKNVNWSLVENIRLTGGEVLLIKGIKELYLFLTQKKGKKVDIITNGTLIDNEWASLLVKGSNQVQISINAATKKTHSLVNKGSNFDKVIHNVKLLIALKRNFQSSAQIIYKYTICDKNIHEMVDAIELAESLGCDMIGYGYDRTTVPFILNKEVELRNQTKKRLVQLRSADLNVKIGLQPLQKLGLLETNRFK